MADIQVFQKDGQPKTTSLNVAAVLGKQHKDVLRAVERLGCSEEFNGRNFALVTYLDARRAFLLEPLNEFGRNKLASMAEELLTKGRLKKSPSRRLVAA